MQPGISIVIVNWNGLKWLEKLFNSISKQTYKNLEVIFVDNNSNDRSVDYIKQNYPDTRVVVNDENLGFATANNIGIKAAVNDIIMLLNTDTWIASNVVAELYKDKVARNLAVIAPREADYLTGKARDPYATLIDLLGHPIFLPYSNKYQSSFYLSGVCLMFSKNDYQATGGLDDSFFMYSEEVDWFWRLKLFGYSYDYSRNAHVSHFGGGSSTSGINKNVFLWRNENTLRMLIKNYNKSSILLWFPLYFLLYFLEMITFLLIGKKKIAKSYAQALVRVYKDKSNILIKRKVIQQNRIHSDKYVMKAMYKGIAKIHHLRFYFEHKLRLNHES